MKKWKLSAVYEFFQKYHSDFLWNALIIFQIRTVYFWIVVNTFIVRLFLKSKDTKALSHPEQSSKF